MCTHNRKAIGWLSGILLSGKFKEAFLGNYFPCERRDVKVEEFLYLKQGNMSVRGIDFEVL